MVKKATGNKDNKKQIKQDTSKASKNKAKKEEQIEELSINEEQPEEYEEIEEEEPKVKKSKRQAKLENAIEGFDVKTGVLYVAHLPWGITEENIKKYFGQFGKINRFILPRSKKSGRIKGYAFLEFETMEIAKEAAKSMNNYILFERILKCEVVEDTSRYNNIFKRWRKQFKFFNRYKAFVEKRNKKKTFTEVKDQVKNYLEKEKLKREKIKALGIEYDFPGYSALITK